MDGAISGSDGALLKDDNIKKLSDGLLNAYQEPLNNVSCSLRELTSKQKSLIEVLEAQNIILQNCQNSEIVKQLFTDVTHCRDRLMSIKKQMVLIHERSRKLKVRSQNVLNKANSRQTSRLQELEREQKLIGGLQSPDNE